MEGRRIIAPVHHVTSFADLTYVEATEFMARIAACLGDDDGLALHLVLHRGEHFHLAAGESPLRSELGTVERLRAFKGISVRGEDETPDAFEIHKAASAIDVLTVTTTMEVGVDIGSLQAVL